VPAGVIEFVRTVQRDPYLDLIRLEELDVAIGDERAIGLYGVAAVLGQAPRPQSLQIFNRDQQRLATEQAERSSFRPDGLFHSVDIIRAKQVPRVALGVLIAVLTLEVAAHAEWSQLDSHLGLAPWCVGLVAFVDLSLELRKLLLQPLELAGSRGHGFTELMPDLDDLRLLLPLDLPEQPLDALGEAIEGIIGRYASVLVSLVAMLIEVRPSDHRRCPMDTP